MYVTRPLSHLLKFPDSVSAYPEGPNSGYLVIQDEESETYSCFGLCKNRTLKDLPFPQNKELTVRYTTGDEHRHVSLNPVFLIPVINQPLSCNRYYAIDPHKKHKGEAFTCSTEEGKATCCFCRCIRDVKPRPLDPNNIYQQFEIVPLDTLCSTRGDFTAISVASDGFPPLFFRRKRWTIYTKTPKDFKLDEAQGIDSTLRARLPQINFYPSEPVVVGKWYCPFVFVKEGSLRNQVERSMYYEMTLEQRWEQIFTFQKNADGNPGNSVLIDVTLEKEEVFIAGKKVTLPERNAVDAVIWFTGTGNIEGEMSLGLRVEVVQRMKWEQERGGWLGGQEREVKIKKMEEFKEGGEWRRFRCFVLVERFNLKRMDGSLAMAYDFKHYHQIKSIWE